MEMWLQSWPVDTSRGRLRPACSCAPLPAWSHHKTECFIEKTFLATRNLLLPLKSCKWKPELTDITFLVYSTWVLVLLQNQYPRQCPYHSWGLLLNLPGPLAWEKWIGFVTTFSSKTFSQYFVAGKAEVNSNLASRMVGLLYLEGVASTEF